MSDPIVNTEEVINPEPAAEAVAEVATPVTPPGAKTDPTELLASLQKEREKRRELEAEIERLQAAPAGEVILSEEGRFLKEQIDRLTGTLSVREKAEQLAAIQAVHPALKDKASEFETYLEENKGMAPEIAAKAFLIENDLVDVQPRKGLEKETGGARAPVKTGRTEAEVAELRKNNYRQYQKELAKGTLWTG